MYYNINSSKVNRKMVFIIKQAPILKRIGAGRVKKTVIYGRVVFFRVLFFFWRVFRFRC